MKKQERCTKKSSVFPKDFGKKDWNWKKNKLFGLFYVCFVTLGNVEKAGFQALAWQLESLSHVLWMSINTSTWSVVYKNCSFGKYCAYPSPLPLGIIETFRRNKSLFSAKEINKSNKSKRKNTDTVILLIF